MNSREKGKRGERELASLLREYGFDAHRGQQYSGKGEDDVTGLEGIHIECKFRDRLNIEDAYDQSRRDAALRGDLPVVMHRKTGDPLRVGWLVTMSLDHFISLYKEWSKNE